MTSEQLDDDTEDFRIPMLGAPRKPGLIHDGASLACYAIAVWISGCALYGMFCFGRYLVRTLAAAWGGA